MVSRQSFYGCILVQSTQIAMGLPLTFKSVNQKIALGEIDPDLELDEDLRRQRENA